MVEEAIKPLKPKKAKIEYLYPGISFRNPTVPRTPKIVRNYPWLMMKWNTPITVVSERKGIPHNNMFGSKVLNRRRAYWRRESKYNTLRRLGHNSREIVSFDDMGLGQIPDEGKFVPTHERGVWGNLQSLLSAAGSIILAKEEAKRKAEVEKERVRLEAEIEKQRGMKNLPLLGVGTGTLVLGSLALYMWLSSR